MSPSEVVSSSCVSRAPTDDNSSELTAPYLTAGAATGQAALGTRWLSDEEQVIWRRLLRAESEIHYLLDRDLRESHQLTLGGYAVLVHLGDAGPDGLRMSDLADLLRLSRSGLTRRVTALVRSGLVARRSCPVDRRGTFASLTPSGRALLTEAAPTHVEGVRHYLIDPLGDLNLLDDGLSRVESALRYGSERIDL